MKFFDKTWKLALSGAAVGLLVIGVATGVYAMSTEGPGSKHAPIILSLVVAHGAVRLGTASRGY